MPAIETWSNFPPGVRQHLLERMRDRAISLEDFNQLRLWIDAHPRCRKAIGTKISARLSSVVEERYQKLSASRSSRQW
jgi:hypothetical protein